MGENLNVLTLGTNGKQLDLDKAFPILPDGNIYVATSGGVESSILLYLALEMYSALCIVPCTIRYRDRRMWEYRNAKNFSAVLGIDYFHRDLGVVNRPFDQIVASSAEQYFNRENKLFDIPKSTDPHFVAGFTGKNTTTLDPEIITPAEQEKYLELFNVHRPFLTLNKVETVDLYFKLGVESLLKYTHSCMVDGDVHCGDCHACWERIDAFDRLGRRDPAIYRRDYKQLVKEVRQTFDTRWPDHRRS